jgi:hypothetical protein
MVRTSFAALAGVLLVALTWVPETHSSALVDKNRDYYEGAPQNPTETERSTVFARLSTLLRLRSSR